MRGANAFFGDDEPVEQQKGRTSKTARCFASRTAKQ